MKTKGQEFYPIISLTRIKRRTYLQFVNITFNEYL